MRPSRRYARVASGDGRAPCAAGGGLGLRPAGPRPPPSPRVPLGAADAGPRVVSRFRVSRGPEKQRRLAVRGPGFDGGSSCPLRRLERRSPGGGRQGSAPVSGARLRAWESTVWRQW